MRPIFSYPPFPGHAVSSLHLLLTCALWSTRLSGAILPGITLCTKLVLWKGDPTLIPGLIIGLAAGIIFPIPTRKIPRNDRTPRNSPL